MDATRRPARSLKRYFVQFTPVGWQVRDRQTGDEMAAFGTGSSEYLYAREKATELNIRDMAAEVYAAGSWPQL